LLGLAASQDLLTDRNWRGVPLEFLVRAQTSRCREKNMVSGGPEVLLNPNATQTLGLALRELCDNALKHGAFSKAGGEVSLLWRINNSEAEPTLEMTWHERGHPLVKPATTFGFGKVVIERLTASGLNASSILSFEPDGVIWRLIAPLKDVVKTGTGDPHYSEPSAEVASDRAGAD
jgi:two-component sensor histidine kinase